MGGRRVCALGSWWRRCCSTASRLRNGYWFVVAEGPAIVAPVCGLFRDWLLEQVREAVVAAG